MNKTEEMQIFLDEYLPNSFSIFEKDNDIELNVGNTIIDKEILLRNFKEPGKKKLEFLSKHLTKNFKVFRLNDYSNYLNESEYAKILDEFRVYLKLNKKRKLKTETRNENTRDESTEQNNQNESTEQNNQTKEQKHEISNDEIDKSKQEVIQKTESLNSQENNNIEWSFEWKVMINNKCFIDGTIKSLSDLHILMQKMTTFFNEQEKTVDNNEQKDEQKDDKKTEMVDANVISFENEFHLELTESDLNDF